MLKQILVWLVVALIWAAIIYYAQPITETFGTVSWFEKNLWSTRSGYVIVWFGIIVIGFLILFGVIPTTSPTENLVSLGTWS